MAREDSRDSHATRRTTTLRDPELLIENWHVAEPTAAILTGIKTTGGAAWKLRNALRLHKETGAVLRAALARAICPSRRDDSSVRELAVEIEERMSRTRVPGRKPNGFVQSARAAGRALLPRRLRLRQLPPQQAIGASFADHLQAWVGEAVAPSDIAGPVEQVHCPEHDTRAEALARRFPAEFERELFSSKNPNDIRQRLAGDLLVHQVVRGERSLTPRERLTLTMTTLLASGTASAAIAGAANAPDTTTAAVTGGAAFLGAIAGAVRGARAFRPTENQIAARESVRAWIADLISQITGRDWHETPDSLRAGLIEALNQAHREPQLSGPTR